MDDLITGHSLLSQDPHKGPVHRTYRYTHTHPDGILKIHKKDMGIRSRKPNKEAHG